MSSKQKKKTVIYISSLGMLEPLGESQVLQYLKYLAQDYPVKLISFEKPSDWNVQKNKERLFEIMNSCSIEWYPLRYLSALGPISGIMNCLRGLLLVLRLSFQFDIRLIHARSYYPAVIALMMNYVKGVPFIFDMRGFWVDEKVDSGRWRRRSLSYKVWKAIERLFIIRAAEIVSLSHAGIKEMKTFSYVTKDMHHKFSMIPTCADLNSFVPKGVPQRLESNIVVGYVGSTQNWYDFDAALRVVKKIKVAQPQSQFLIVNKGEHDFIKQNLNRHGFETRDFTLKTVTYSEMVPEIQKMDVCVFFIKKLYSKKASNPTKLGELLGCGVPCITGSDIGDVDKIVRDNNVGVILENLDERSIDQAVQKLFELLSDPSTPKRCRMTAEKFYSVSMGVKKYAEIYAKYS